MTTRAMARKGATERRGTFPDFPPRDDMQNHLFLYQPALASALEIHLEGVEGVAVMCETPVGPNVRFRGNIRIPDLSVTFNSNRALIVRERGHSIESQGKAPDFVLEIASYWTGRVDDTEKREDYERYGVLEYWRFDPTGGDYHERALAGDRLVDGRYEPIEIEELAGDNCRGYSEVLGLWLCWEDGLLRFYDAVSGMYLRTYAEETAERRAAEARAAAESARADEEAARADEAAEARRVAEAELRRLRERMEGGDSGFPLSRE